MPDTLMTQALAVKCNSLLVLRKITKEHFDIQFLSSPEQAARLERLEHRALWPSNVYGMAIASALKSEVFSDVLSGPCLDRDLPFTIEDFLSRRIDKICFIHPNASTHMRFWSFSFDLELSTRCMLTITVVTRLREVMTTSFLQSWNLPQSQVLEYRRPTGRVGCEIRSVIVNTSVVDLFIHFEWNSGASYECHSRPDESKKDQPLHFSSFIFSFWNIQYFAKIRS